MTETRFIRFLKTLSLFFAYFTNGMVMSMIGPTILEFQCILDISYEQITKVFPARASGYAMGSFLVGILYDRLNPLLTNTVTLLIVGVSTTAMPWATSLPVLLVMTFMSTLGCGMIDSTANVFILHLWGKESQPYLQALHFAYGLGGLVAPLVVSPFLSASADDGLASNATVEPRYHCDPSDVHIHIPFAILGVYALVVAILFLYLFCFHRKTEAHASRIAKAVTMMLEAKKESVWKKRIVVMVAAMFMFTALGFEVGMGSFITSFAVMSDLHLTKQVGAYMTSLYWAMFTSFKLIAVGVSDKIGPYCSIIIDLIVLIVANAFLLPFGNSVQWCLWIGVSLVGVGTSSIWAALFGFLDNYVPVTSKIASFLIVSACVGEWVFPTIMGYAVETHPQIFLWVLTLCTLLCCILFFILNLLCRNFISLAASRKASADKVTRVPGNRHISVCSHVDFK